MSVHGYSSQQFSSFTRRLHVFYLLHHTFCFAECLKYQPDNIFFSLPNLQTNWLNNFSTVCRIRGRKISKLSLQTSVLLIYIPCSLTWCAHFNFSTTFSIACRSVWAFYRSFFISKFDRNLYVFEKFILRWSFWCILFLFQTFLCPIFVNFLNSFNNYLFYFILVKIIIWIN